MRRVTNDQSNFLRIVQRTERNIFLTGGAGTGKSYILQIAVQKLKSMKKNVVVVAPTGIAARNINGNTMHSTFKLPLEVYCGEKKLKIPEVVRKADIIIIDEISMCRIDTFSAVMDIINQVNKKTIRLIVCGDFYQLPPVVNNSRRQNGELSDYDVLKKVYGNDVGHAYAFQSPKWAACNFQLCELKEIVRQSDVTFSATLNNIRRGIRIEQSITYLTNNMATQKEDRMITICGRNDTANKINQKKLQELNKTQKTYRAKEDGIITNDDRSVPPILKLCPGARVIICANGTDNDGKKYINGQMGTVERCKKDSVEVILDDGGIVDIPYYEWSITRYGEEVDKDGNTVIVLNEIGRYRQIPLKLAYAISIHKSQGQTFEWAIIIPDVWECGQLYTALSRVKSIDGLYIEGKIKPGQIMCAEETEKYYRDNCTVDNDNAEKLCNSTDVEEIDEDSKEYVPVMVPVEYVEMVKKNLEECRVENYKDTAKSKK